MRPVLCLTPCARGHRGRRGRTRLTDGSWRCGGTVAALECGRELRGRRGFIRTTAVRTTPLRRRMSVVGKSWRNRPCIPGPAGWRHHVGWRVTRSGCMWVASGPKLGNVKTWAHIARSQPRRWFSCQSAIADRQYAPSSPTARWSGPSSSRWPRTLGPPLPARTRASG